MSVVRKMTAAARPLFFAAIVFGPSAGFAASATESSVHSINGSDRLSINGSDQLSINGSDLVSINGSDQLSINGSDSLLALGQVDHIGDGFLSVLGQTVIGADSDFAGISTGSTIAVFGSMDAGTGGFSNTRIVSVSPSGIDSGLPSFLRGTVDAVDAAMGRAVVSGITVDYTAMLSSGSAPSVGDRVAVSGRSYRGLGLLVAEPEGVKLR